MGLTSIKEILFTLSTMWQHSKKAAIHESRNNPLHSSICKALWYGAIVFILKWCPWAVSTTGDRYVARYTWAQHVHFEVRKIWVWIQYFPATQGTWISWFNFCLFVLLACFETGFLYVALTVLQLTLLTWLASNSALFVLALKVCATTTRHSFKQNSDKWKS